MRILLRVAFGIIVLASAPAAAAHAQGAPAPAAEAAALRAERDSVVQLLKDVVRAEETFFSGHNTYTDSLPLLKLSVRKHWTVKLDAAPANWAAIVSTTKIPGMECAVAVDRKNPLKADAGEGEPVCRK